MLGGGRLGADSRRVRLASHPRRPFRAGREVRDPDPLPLPASHDGVEAVVDADACAPGQRVYAKTPIPQWKTVAAGPWARAAQLIGGNQLLGGRNDGYEVFDYTTGQIVTSNWQGAVANVDHLPSVGEGGRASLAGEVVVDASMVDIRIECADVARCGRIELGTLDDGGLSFSVPPLLREFRAPVGQPFLERRESLLSPELLAFELLPVSQLGLLLGLLSGQHASRRVEEIALAPPRPAEDVGALTPMALRGPPLLVTLPWKRALGEGPGEGRRLRNAFYLGQ
jgi:hypothetical protein